MGFLGGISTESAVNEWYVTLNKPSFNPPNYLFAPVWTVLYILMGVSAALVWNAGWEKHQVSNSLMVFLAQLVLNGLWSTVFFGMRSPVGGMVIIALLAVVLLLTIVKFFRVSKTSALLLLPYLLWVLFAAVLNASIVSLN